MAITPDQLLQMLMGGMQGGVQPTPPFNPTAPMPFGIQTQAVPMAPTPQDAAQQQQAQLLREAFSYQPQPVPEVNPMQEMGARIADAISAWGAIRARNPMARTDFMGPLQELRARREEIQRQNAQGEQASKQAAARAQLALLEKSGDRKYEEGLYNERTGKQTTKQRQDELAGLGVDPFGVPEGQLSSAIAKRKKELKIEEEQALKDKEAAKVKDDAAEREFRIRLARIQHSSTDPGERKEAERESKAYDMARTSLFAVKSQIRQALREKTEVDWQLFRDEFGDFIKSVGLSPEGQQRAWALYEQEIGAFEPFEVPGPEAPGPTPQNPFGNLVPAPAPPDPADVERRRLASEESRRRGYQESLKRTANLDIRR